MLRIFTHFMLSALALSIVNLPSRASDWPNDKPIRIIVPFEPAGLVDIIGRIIADNLTKEIGQTFFVENRGGAGGKNGSLQAMRAPPDGYTLVLSGLASHVIAPLTTEIRPYDGVADFTHIAYLSGPPLVIAVSGNSDLRSLADIVSYAREAKIAGYASAGVGTLSHIIMETVLKHNKITIPHVPYNTAALNDMIAGRVPVGVFSYGPVSAQAGAGALRMIALSTADRHPAVAETPTLKELGYDIIAPSWVALSAPAALDASIVLRLNEATNRILSREEIKARLFEDAIQTQPLNPAQTRAFVEAETAAWKDRLRVIQMLK